MKFEHAATPFTYTLYTHTGSLHKKLKITWKILFCLPYFYPPPPPGRTPSPLSRQYLQAPPPPLESNGRAIR